MGAIATFVYSDWYAVYQQFSNVGYNRINNVVLPVAQIYCRNDGGGPINDVTTQTQALWLMVAHVAQIMFGSVDQPLTGAVGRVASAGQGSVSVSLDYATPGSEAWFNQTPYGAAYIAMVKPFTMGFYAPKQTPVYRPWIYN